MHIVQLNRLLLTKSTKGKSKMTNIKNYLISALVTFFITIFCTNCTSPTYIIQEPLESSKDSTENDTTITIEWLTENNIDSIMIFNYVDELGREQKGNVLLTVFNNDTLGNTTLNILPSEQVHNINMYKIKSNDLPEWESFYSVDKLLDIDSIKRYIEEKTSLTPVYNIKDRQVDILNKSMVIEITFTQRINYACGNPYSTNTTGYCYLSNFEVNKVILFINKGKISIYSYGDWM